MPTHLKPGDPAPGFSGLTGDGTRIGLEDFHGRTLILYFYPMDDTPGCTKQACSLRDRHVDLLMKGAAVVGVSAQGVESHRDFARKYGLGFPLVADPGQEIARAYGVAGSGVAGLLRGLVGASERVTFIIDGDGHIAHVIESPSLQEHGEEVLSYL